jgi:hypothetical protein
MNMPVTLSAVVMVEAYQTSQIQPGISRIIVCSHTQVSGGSDHVRHGIINIRRALFKHAPFPKGLPRAAAHAVCWESQ